MKRLHLFEFEDQSWFPKLFRNVLTSGLHGMITTFGLYTPIVPILKNLIEQVGAIQVVDLASGAGGPWPELQSQLIEQGCSVSVVLTDKYPNTEVLKKVPNISEGNMHYVTESIDALDVPTELSGVRTIFTGLHHFRPEMAQRLLQDAVDKGEAIAVFEFTERSWLNVLLAPVRTIPTTLFFVIPIIIRPLRFSVLFWTYIIPLIPVSILWDGLVSTLRTYSVEELTAMYSSVNGYNTYRWEAGQVSSEKLKFIKTLYLIGYPNESN